MQIKEALRQHLRPTMKKEQQKDVLAIPTVK